MVGAEVFLHRSMMKEFQRAVDGKLLFTFSNYKGQRSL